MKALIVGLFAALAIGTASAETIVTNKDTSQQVVKHSEADVRPLWVVLKATCNPVL